MKNTLNRKGLCLALILLLVAVSLSLAACGKTYGAESKTPASDGTPVDSLKGQITISGAFALYPMMVKWAEEFQKLHPGVQIDISAGGAGKGAADALGKLADIGMVSRDINQSELDQGGFYVGVVKDAVVATMNVNNPFKKELLSRGIKRDEFASIWIDGKVRDWKDLFPGSTAGSDSLIKVYTRSDACGAADIWAKYLGKKQEDFYGSMDKIIQAIKDGKYPSPPARELNLLTYKEFKGVTLEFVKWILTDGQKYVAEAGYIQLSPDRLASQLAKLR